MISITIGTVSSNASFATTPVVYRKGAQWMYDKNSLVTNGVFLSSFPSSSFRLIQEQDVIH
jgi:hypothetical protein